MKAVLLGQLPAQTGLSGQLPVQTGLAGQPPVYPRCLDGPRPYGGLQVECPQAQLGAAPQCQVCFPGSYPQSVQPPHVRGFGSFLCGHESYTQVCFPSSSCERCLGGVFRLAQHVMDIL